jgi:alkaline phosphatase
MKRWLQLTQRLIQRSVSLLMVSLLCNVSLMFAPWTDQVALALDANASRQKQGSNVILMIGDGMGWQMTRAAAAANTGRLYNMGKGSGLNMQRLQGYTYATTYPTTIGDKDGVFDTGNSALDGSKPGTGASPLRAGFKFNPTLNPGTPIARPAATGFVTCQDGAGTTGNGGNIVGYEPRKGGPNPWTPLSPANPGPVNPEYIKCSYPDSANTAAALYTGRKSYDGAMSVDIYEQGAETILQSAAKLGKSTGLVTSVPISHATPGAATANVNRRSKYDADYPALDNILQQALRPDVATKFLPTVLIGGGHPLDFENETATSTIAPQGFRYIKKSTYEELRTKPASNRYGYTFLERDPKVTSTNDVNTIVDGGKVLLQTARAIDPNKGQRLLGLYGARGQNGNIPTRAAKGDYATTGLDNFTIYSSAATPTQGDNGPPDNGTQIAQPDTVRPLVAGETAQNFIAKEVKANPTLTDMTKAALAVLEKDRDGFWLMIEGGDVDWAAHDNNMDDLIGNVLAFDRAVDSVIEWIENHGGWERNTLIVTADHDHYLTLNNDFPQQLRQKGAKAITVTANSPQAAGHFWGSEPTVKYGWGSHTNRPVPVYFQGRNFRLNDFIGKPVEIIDRPPNGPVTTYQIPGVPGAVDQTHIYKAMLNALRS